MKNLISTKNRSLNRWSVRPRGESHNLFTNGRNVEPFNEKLIEFTFFHQHFQPLYDVMQKEIQDNAFVRCVNFEIIDSLENNSPKYLLIFDDSCEES